MRIPLRPVAAAGLALLAAACDGTNTVEGVLAPSALGSDSTVTGGGSAGNVVARGSTPLLGSWTRVSDGGAGVLTEQTFVFAGDGTGTRLTLTRTALGVAITAEQQPFRWSAGAGILLLRLQRPGTVDTLLRASYLVLVDVTGTVLRLDGADYRRTGG